MGDGNGSAACRFFSVFFPMALSMRYPTSKLHLILSVSKKNGHIFSLAG
jgi:hypothetical protein